HNFFDMLDLGGPLFLGVMLLLLLLVPLVLRWNLYSREFYLEKEKVSIDDTLKRLIGLWIIVPTIIYLLPLSGLNDFHYYYFFVLFPVLIFLLGLGLFQIFKHGLHRLGVYMIVVFLLLQFIQMGVYINH